MGACIMSVFKEISVLISWSVLYRSSVVVDYVQLYTQLMEDRDFGSKLSQIIRTAPGLRTIGGTSQTSAEGTTHSVRDEEQVAFSNWINK